jgi:hypothetical protein
MWINARHAQGNLVRVGFSENDRAGKFEFQHRLGVFRRDVIGKKLRATRRADTRHVKQVFYSQWNTEQGQLVQIGGLTIQKCVGLHGSLDSQFGRGGNEGIDRRVEAFNLTEAGLGQFERGEVLTTELLESSGQSKGG